MSVETVTLSTAIVGAVCGVAGTLFGVFNTWQQIRRDKLRLKVVPTHVTPVGAAVGARVNFGINVTNMSEFPVVIADVGFLLVDGRMGTIGTVGGMEPKGSLPMRLEPRTQYTKYFWLDNSVINFATIRSAYARTECGNTVRGTSPALKQLIRQVPANRN